MRFFDLPSLSESEAQSDCTLLACEDEFENRDFLRLLDVTVESEAQSDSKILAFFTVFLHFAAAFFFNFRSVDFKVIASGRQASMRPAIETESGPATFSRCSGQPEAESDSGIRACFSSLPFALDFLFIFRSLGLKVIISCGLASMDAGVSSEGRPVIETEGGPATCSRCS